MPLSTAIRLAFRHNITGFKSYGVPLTHALLAGAKRMLAIDPTAAVKAARRAVAALPASVEAHFILGAALRRSGELDDAFARLAPLADLLFGVWGAHYELGMTLAGLGRIEEALTTLEAAARLNPESSLVLHALGDMLVLSDLPARAAELQGRPVAGSIGDAQLATAAAAWLMDGDAAPLGELGLHLSDIAAVCLVADAGLRAGMVDAVAAMLARALAVTPSYLPARYAFAISCHRLDRNEDALASIDSVLAAVPGVAALRAMRATIQMQRGDVMAAIADYAAAVGTDAAVWHSFGHALRAAGRHDEAVAAYRRALALQPSYAEVYWSLANLKTWRFTDADRAEMVALLPDAEDDDRASLQFALGKADDDGGEPAASFAHYAAGNTARRLISRYDRAAHEDFISRSIDTFTADFFAARVGGGDPAPDPVFVVGLPRSGSTLVEQILASHPLIDGLSELPDLPRIAQQLAAPYPDRLTGLTAAAVARVGRDYLDRTQPRRTPGRTRFVDKFPGNFLHAGLIHLALPNATIVDVRRDPVATCFSLFKQLFARGQAYSYDLADLGHYYQSYVALMNHFAAVLPGRVLTLSYETLVDDAEAETRRLLAHAGLAFDPACLRFYASSRPVRTASSEQVRQPIYRSGLDDWRRYERWLGPLIEALGPLAAPVQSGSMPIFDDPIR